MTRLLHEFENRRRVLTTCATHFLQFCPNDHERETLTANLPTRVLSDMIPERVSAITDYISIFSSRRPRKSVGSLS